jgi:integrase
LATKRDKRPKTQENLRKRLDLWAATLGPDRQVHDVSRAELKSFLADYEPQNRKNYRSALHNFFGWCVDEGAAPENPVSKIEIPDTSSDEDPHYLHHADVKAMLRQAMEQGRWDIIAWIVLGAFCGLRPFEALRVEWHSIKWETQELRIERRMTKKKKPRTFKLTDTAFAWLSVIPRGEPSSTILGYTENQWNVRWQEWRKENQGVNGIPPWELWQDAKTKDILRKTFITHRVNVIHDEPRVAHEAGTSVEMIHDNYDGVLEESQAAPFWSILPSS